METPSHLPSEGFIESRSSSPFVELPLELRSMIYLLLLPCQEQLELQGHWKQRLKRPSQQRPRKEADEQSQTRNAFRKMSTTILLLNKMVYREVKELVCMKNLSINSWISVFLLPVEDLLGYELDIASSRIHGGGDPLTVILVEFVAGNSPPKDLLDTALRTTSSCLWLLAPDDLAVFWNTLDRSTSEPLGGLLLQFHGKTWQRKDANNDDAPLIVKRYAPRTEGASVVPYWPELAKEVNGMPGLSTSLQKRIDESPMDISGLKWICHQQLLDSMRAQLQTTARCSPEQAFAICSAAIMSYNYAQQSRTPVGALLRHEDEWTGPELAALKGTPFGLHRHMAQQYIRRMISELDKAKRKQLCHERLSITKQALEIEHFERTKADEPDMHLVSAQAIFAGLLDSQAANYQRVLEQAEELDRCIDLANLRPEQVQPFEEMYQVVMQGQWKKR